MKLTISHLHRMPESLGLHANPFLKLDLGLPGSTSTGFNVFIQKYSPLISLLALFNDVCKETEQLSWIRSVISWLFCPIKLICLEQCLL